MRGIQMANSLVDWLNEETKDPKTHEWGYDRVAFFGPKPRVRSRETDPRWQERVDAAEPSLKDFLEQERTTILPEQTSFRWTLI